MLHFIWAFTPCQSTRFKISIVKWLLSNFIVGGIYIFVFEVLLELSCAFEGLLQRQSANAKTNLLIHILVRPFDTRIRPKWLKSVRTKV